jgi:transcriptional regulator with XRE-family HTH domain
VYYLWVFLWMQKRVTFRVVQRRTLAELLRAAIGERTQEEAAAALGTSPASLSRWLAGTTPPQLRNVPKLAEFLGLERADVAGLIYAQREAAHQRSPGVIIGELIQTVAAMEQRLARLEEQMGEPGTGPRQSGNSRRSARQTAPPRQRRAG